MTFINSITEPGQPCAISSGKAFSCFERTWMKWISRPSIWVMKFGTAFIFDSMTRQSYRVAQWLASFWIVAS
ncbi:hypothetical protein D3C81_2070180 [compost metagenome]